MFNLKNHSTLIIGLIALFGLIIWMIYMRKEIYTRLESAFGEQNARIKKVEQIVYHQQQEFMQLFQPYPSFVQPVPSFQQPVVNPIVVQQPVQQQPVQQSVKPVVKPKPVSVVKPKPNNEDSISISPEITNTPPSPRLEPIPEESLEDLDALLKEELAELEYSEPIEDISTEDSLKKTN